MIHPLSDVQSDNIGKGTQIWQYSIILKGAKIGANCNINCHTFIENDVVLGNKVTIKSGVYIWDGIEISDEAFIGPNVTFTNDMFPRSKKRTKFLRTTIGQGASIGAASSILAGINIGKYSMIGMGSVVTKDVPDYALVYGQPATFKCWLDEKGQKLVLKHSNIFQSPSGKEYIQENNKLYPKI